MPDKKTDDHVPEFAHLDTVTRRRELAAAGSNPNQKLDALRKSLKMPNLVSVETEVDSFVIDPPPRACIERFEVRGLSVGPDQRLQKKVYEQYQDGLNCIRTISTFNFQFMGYGPYTMSFFLNVDNTNPFENFFSDLARYKINLHRTMVFANEVWEDVPRDQVLRVLSDTNPGVDGGEAKLNTNYLQNLNRLVLAAKDKGIVVQVCLFVHHSVAADEVVRHPLERGVAGPPQPVVIRGRTPYDRYKAFFNVSSSSHRKMQENLIDGIVQTLLPHWNVVYEIGNELRVPPGPANATYGEANLKAWIDWAARRIRSAPNRVSDTAHLITTSTGVPNERLINDDNQLIEFCSFHQPQWSGAFEEACQRALDYGDKHVVFDDDGGAAGRTPDAVKDWAKNVLKTRGGCRVSFNHKGPGCGPRYDPEWVNKDYPIIRKPIQVLPAFLEGRTDAPACP